MPANRCCSAVRANQDQVLVVLQLPDRPGSRRWRWPEVDALVRTRVGVEGIISLKTGGCRRIAILPAIGDVRLPGYFRKRYSFIPSLVEAAKQTAKSGATEFCTSWPPVRGPDERLMAQVRPASGRFATSRDQHHTFPGDAAAEQVDQLAAGCIATTTTSETARSFFANVYRLGRALAERYRWCVTRAWRFCCGILGMGRRCSSARRRRARLG